MNYDLNLFNNKLLFKYFFYITLLLYFNNLYSSKFIPYIARVTLINTQSGYFYYFYISKAFT
jgi:hypothetical protein